MATRAFRFICPSVLLLAVAALDAGGWVVVTVRHLPEYVVAGEPVTLTYGVRQHGMRLLDGLSGRIEARNGKDMIAAEAVRASEPGHYTASLTLPRAGEWALDIVTSFGGPRSGSRITLLAIGRGERAPVLSESERGRQLYVAKGCDACHAHGAVVGRSTAAGANLTTKRYAPEFLKQFLAHPPRREPFVPGEWQMPDLALQDKEIAALTAFLNADSAGTARR